LAGAAAVAAAGSGPVTASTEPPESTLAPESTVSTESTLSTEPTESTVSPESSAPDESTADSAPNASAAESVPSSTDGGDVTDSTFNHVGTFNVTANLADGEPIETPTVAEIVDATSDGSTLVYTDAATGRLGFVDIADPASPEPLGALDLGGDPTSVTVAGTTAFVGINTSESFTEPSGELVVVDVGTQAEVTRYDLDGQPDSVALSPDGAYVAIVIENERDEDLDDGLIPQAPPGLLQILTLDDAADPAAGGELASVDLTGVADVAGDDPEPEFVDINTGNVAVVTLQENNHLVLVDLPSGEVVDHFSAGVTDVELVDIADDGLIELTETLTYVRREPDAVAWIDDEHFATADEGDYVDADGVAGGSRSFTVFSVDGTVVYESGSSFEHAVAAAGHYPDGRSDAQGVEPEGVEFGEFAGRPVLFVGSERGNVVGVYDVTDPADPELRQLLPTSMGPEGIVAIPDRDLVAVSAEVDGLAEDPDDQFPVRSLITLYELGDGPARYPYLVSVDEAAGTPVPWVALSGLTADPDDDGVLWAVSDSFLAQAWIYRIDVTTTPATITERIAVGGPDGSFDLEGIAARAEGGFWLASEGNEERANQVLLVDADGELVGDPVELPAELTAGQTSNGLEGVAVTGSEADGDEVVWVAVQREWAADPEGLVRIGRYDVAAGEWTFAFYPLDPVESPAGGWVGLSELTLLDDGTLAVVERDNQLGLSAAIKRVYVIDPSSVEFVPYGFVVPVLDKELLVDALPALDAASISVPDKLEGLAVTADGTMWAVTDNDGVDENYGETVLITL
jgi:hypothetical protein